MKEYTNIFNPKENYVLKSCTFYDRLKKKILLNFNFKILKPLKIILIVYNNKDRSLCISAFSWFKFFSLILALYNF